MITTKVTLVFPNVSYMLETPMSCNAMHLISSLAEKGYLILKRYIFTCSFQGEMTALDPDAAFDTLYSRNDKIEIHASDPLKHIKVISIHSKKEHGNDD